MSEVSGDIPAIKADAAGDGDHPPTLAATGAPVGDARLAEPAQFRMVLVSFLAAAIGLIAGCVAFLLYKLIGLFTNIVFYHRLVAEFTSARHHQLGAWVILMPVIGGVIVGFMAKYGTAKIKGHGIPEAMEAVLINRSRIEPRVAILKPISAAIAIGTGGPFGAEGPIIQTGGAVGFSRLLYWTEDQFEKLPVDELWWPAISALGLGIIGYFVPRVLGVGYDTISDILNANLALKLLIIVMIAKAIALVISLGSGTSGGLLAPMFMSSAALGGAFAIGTNHLFSGANLSPGAFALVAMGAVFGAASRATFSFIIFAFEITRDYNSVLPLMLVSVIADGIAMILMPSASIMTEKLARRGLRIHQDYEADVLHQVVVAETMDCDVPTLPASMRVGELAARIAKHDPVVSRHQGMVIVDAEGRLAGIITRADVLRALDQDPLGEMTVLEGGSRKLVVTYPDESLHEASAKMLRNNIGRLPVVERSDPRKVVGYLGRPGIMVARLRRLEEEHVREPGWVKGVSRR